MSPTLYSFLPLALATASSLSKTIVSVERRDFTERLSAAESFQSHQAVNFDIRALPSLLASSGHRKLDTDPNHVGVNQCLASEVETLHRVGMQVLQTGSVHCGLSTEEFCDYLHKAAELHPELSVVMCEADTTIPLSCSSIPVPGELVASVVDDPLIGQEYALDMIGMAKAWKRIAELQTKEVIVAVIDTGVDITHEDLQGSLWSDAKGLHGQNFVGDSADLADTVGHGTHVAGILGAQVNNQLGIAGVDPNVRLMIIKTDEEGMLLLSAVVAGIDYAIANGASVVSMSWSTMVPMNPLVRAMKSAESNGLVLVAAAGNENTHVPVYPCAFSWVLCVAATSTTKQLTSYSNWGPHVDVAAPGDKILSTWKNGRYALNSGTSMATPIAAALASVLLGMGVHPADVKPIISNNVDKLGDVGKPTSGGFINAAMAVGSVTSRVVFL